MALQIGDTAPDFEAQTTEGKIRFHDWLGNSWAVLFSHPKDFTPVCTTELGYMARIKPEFDKRGVKIIGLSVDPVEKHAQVGERHQGDARLRAELSDDRRHRPRRSPRPGACCRPSATGDASKRTAMDNQTVRNVFVIGPDKKIKLILVYPMTTGRNFDEVLRVIDSLQLTAKHKVATPVNWKHGDDVIIAGSVSDDDAKKTYPQGWKSPKPYIRIVPQPGRDSTSVARTDIVVKTRGPRNTARPLLFVATRQCATKTRYCWPPSASQASCLVHSWTRPHAGQTRRRLHRRKLLDIEHLDAGRHFSAGRRTLDHEDTHDSLLVFDCRLLLPTTPHERVATVTAPINSSWLCRHG